MSDYVARHLSLPQPNCRELKWFEFVSGDRCRAVAWTCDCTARFYELYAMAGVGFIRRTIQRTPVSIAETNRWPLRQAREVWADIMAGRAR
ncbi:hypothetical protein [Microtetraspora malaysiensis]|uniref:hypothetical protein n=1 Tax=Microtetraspora malaysiensis TaxID=161358 RepID=UPI003D8FC6E9